MEKRPIYLDYNATTPIDPKVLQAMLPFFKQDFGNPSSSHAYGHPVKDAIAKAREQTANLIGAQSSEVLFTSGGTESNNNAIIGTAFANMEKGKHIVTSQIEHPATLETVGYLKERFGFTVTYLPVDNYGMVNPSDLKNAITPQTILITVMHANNEVGTINPIEEIGKIAKENKIAFHTDAAQSCGKIPVNVNQLNVDLLSIAGHKLYAPKGIGALYIRKGTKLDKFIHGAGQEQGRRAGTENVPYIAGLGSACEIASESIYNYSRDIKALRDRLHRNIIDGLGKERVRLNGHPTKRLPNTLNISISGIIGETLLAKMPEIAASTGSACHAGSTKPSAVLLAMGLSNEQALGALRLSLGRGTTVEEVDKVARLIVDYASS
ncbi:MAG TPA: cysteine desulfurase family protein [Candidatus Acidoferrales bacterium]|nr:cysteine desulfurase family protein [Candidatus Acidoferrales bacterium]